MLLSILICFQFIVPEKLLSNEMATITLAEEIDGKTKQKIEEKIEDLKSRNVGRGATAAMSLVSYL